MTVGSPSSLSGRLRGIPIFLAIVWGVAASFVAFELLALRGFSTLRGSSLAVPIAVQRSTVCEAPDVGVVPGAVAGNAWMLGIYAGTEARIAPSLGPGGVTSDDPQQQERLQARARDLNARAHADTERAAAALTVPPPPTFSPRNAVNALVEYGPFVEGSNNVTARALATRYGRRTCELYKLGSYWGFGALMQDSAAGLEHPFDVEVAFYARRLAIPEDLWQPMIAPKPAAVAGERQPDSDALTNGVRTYLSVPR